MPPKVKLVKDIPELTNDTIYSDWRKDVRVWRLANKDADKKQIGCLLYLSLKGKAREYVRDINDDDLSSDTGFDIVLKKLDEIYLKEKDTRAYLAFEEFVNYKRKNDDDIRDFIVHYDYLYGKLAEFEMVLPEGFQAFFLLNAANLSEDHQKLARATCAALTYKEMKSNILNIFGDFSHRNRDSSSSTSVSGISIKTEPAYLAENDEEALFTGSRGRGRGHGGYYKKKSFIHESALGLRMYQNCYWNVVVGYVSEYAE